MQFLFQVGRIDGQRALLAAWACWLLCFLAMPISTVSYGTVQTVALFICANAALLFGLSCGSWVPQKSTHLSYQEEDLSRILFLIAFAGIFAIVAKLIDLTVYRGILEATSFTEGRQRMESNGSNLFSGIYFGLSPVIAAGGILSLVLIGNKRYRRLSITALVLFCINPIFSFVFGGRSILFMTAGLIVITWSLLVPKVTKPQLLCLFGLGAALFFVTMYLFVGRVTEAVGEHVEILAAGSHYTKLVPLNIDTIETMRDLPRLERYFLYYVTSVGQYIVHGVFEFFYLVQAKSQEQGLLWGRYQFTLYDQALRAMLGPGDVPDLEVFNPTTGLFSTFWGPAYIDFGYLMVIYGFLFGYVTGRVRGLVERGDLFALPLYALLIFQIFLVPIANGLLMASSVVLNVGFFGIWLLTRWYLAGNTKAVNVAG